MNCKTSTEAHGLKIEVGTKWFERGTQGREVVTVDHIWRRTILFSRDESLSVGPRSDSRIAKYGGSCGRCEFVAHYEPLEAVYGGAP